MNKQEAISLLKHLQPFFDVVRLVNIYPHTCYQLNEDGTDLIAAEHKCYEVWNRGGVCANCISSRTINTKSHSTKLEYIDNTIFSIASNYVEVDGEAFSLELVSKIEIDTVFSGLSPSFIINSIDDYNQKLYKDSLAQCYNRLYFDERIPEQMENVAVAYLDIDNMKHINDAFGHAAGDTAISTIASIVKSNIRGTDYLMRIGGDEFVVVFTNIPYVVFANKLVNITKQIAETALPDYPGLKLSSSIGGVYGGGLKSELIKQADELLYQAKQNHGSVAVDRVKA